MKRAAELFAFETRSSTSPLVTTTWQTRTDESVDSFLSVAAAQWEIVVTRQGAAGWVSVRGPETRASTAPVPEDAEIFGVQFSLGTFMPDLDMPRLADGELTLPLASGRSFWLDGSAWEIPRPDNADVFVDRLVRAGLLIHDPVASAALHDDVQGLSTRTVERRVARATGLTRGTIMQIRRAERAVEMLSRGVPALDVARRAGYADQPHLTRSLKRFVGVTPAQIVAGV
jgi:AraC-like DNA-binding protein